MALNLSSLAWKQLVGETVTVADLTASDSSVVTFASKFMDLAANGMSREAYEDTFEDQRWEYGDARGVMVPVVPGGSSKRVTYEEAPDFARAVLHFRLHESDEAAAEVRLGLSTIVPVDLMNIWTWQDMDRMVCTSHAAPARRSCAYSPELQLTLGVSVVFFHTCAPVSLLLGGWRSKPFN